MFFALKIRDKVGFLVGWVFYQGRTTKNGDCAQKSGRSVDPTVVAKMNTHMLALKPSP